MYFVYILKSLNKNWYYVGSTEDTSRRLAEHNAGKTRSTKAYAPFKLVYKEVCTNKTEGRQRENSIKKNHALKSALLADIS